MNIQKEAILKALESVVVSGEKHHIVEDGSVFNINIFGDEVIVDIQIPNPSLQAKKKVEVDIMKAIHDKVHDKAKVKVNIKVVVPEKPSIVTDKAIPGIKNIIAVASGKGGVGKSTVTANIAVTLTKMGFKVGILDADIYGPSMPIMFDVANERPLSVNIDGKPKMKPVENYGAKLLSIGFFTNPNEAVIWRGAMASNALKQMVFDAHWGELDFMLVDLPPGTGDIHLSIMQTMPVTGAVIVSTPQNIALADAKRGVAMFQQENIKVPVLGMIENMSYFVPTECNDQKYYIFGKDGAKNLAKDIDTPLLGEIPLEISIREAGDIGRPAAMQEGTATAKAFEKLTQNMITELVKRNESLPPTEIIKITTMAGCATN
jgi:ATP-binding protein involved in chromosome partitioning